jgi:hypothetical protein
VRVSEATHAEDHPDRLASQHELGSLPSRWAGQEDG